MRLYKPDSLTVSNSRGPAVVRILVVPVSSSSSLSTALLGSPMSRMSHISLATNQASPSLTTVRTRLVSNVNSTGRFFGFAAASAISSKDINRFLVKDLPLDHESEQEGGERLRRMTGRGGIALAVKEAWVPTARTRNAN